MTRTDSDDLPVVSVSNRHLRITFGLYWLVAALGTVMAGGFGYYWRTESAMADGLQDMKVEEAKEQSERKLADATMASDLTSEKEFRRQMASDIHDLSERLNGYSNISAAATRAGGTP